jgi:hypothetical protein
MTTGNDAHKTPPKFRLRKETVAELGVEELAMVSGGATFSCCIGCNTDGSSWCSCGSGSKSGSK